MKSRPSQPDSGRRTASIKETGEEVPLAQWERFEAAVGIGKLRPGHAGAEIRDIGKSR